MSLPNPDQPLGLAGTVKLGHVEPVSVDDVRLRPADRPSFDELLAAADDDELASAAVYGVTSSPELVPGLSFGQAAQINARISAHVAAVDAAAAILGPHLEQHRLDLLLRRHERLGLHLGYEVTPTTSHDCRLKLLWTPHDVHLVAYAPSVAARRPGTPAAWEVATDVRFEAHAGRALPPAVIAAAAIAAVDTIEAS